MWLKQQRMSHAYPEEDACVPLGTECYVVIQERGGIRVMMKNLRLGDLSSSAEERKKGR